MPLLQTFRSLFLRVPSPTPDVMPRPAAVRRWPPPRSEPAETPDAADWDTLRSDPPDECEDSISNAESTFDRNIFDSGSRPKAEMAPRPPYESSPASIPAGFVDHSAAAGAMWPDDEDQAAVSRRAYQIARADGVHGGTSVVVVPITNRRPRVNPLSLTAELPIVRFDY